MNAIDIVISTRDRAELLSRTLTHIAERTSTPHAITVIDDGSKDCTPVVLGTFRQLGVVGTIQERLTSRGIPAALRESLSLTQSDPLVFTDDDVLCPKVAPDWLARLLAEMGKRPKLGILALNSPQNHPSVGGDRRRVFSRDGEVTLCRNVGGRFTLIRRAVLEAVSVPDGTASPMKLLCIQAGVAGFGVGYLTRTYCQHIGAVSVRNGLDMSHELALVAPVDDEALEPPVAYRE